MAAKPCRVPQRRRGTGIRENKKNKIRELLCTPCRSESQMTGWHGGLLGRESPWHALFCSRIGLTRAPVVVVSHTTRKQRTQPIHAIALHDRNCTCPGLKSVAVVRCPMCRGLRLPVAEAQIDEDEDASCWWLISSHVLRNLAIAVLQIDFVRYCYCVPHDKCWTNKCWTSSPRINPTKRLASAYDNDCERRHIGAVALT